MDEPDTHSCYLSGPPGRVTILYGITHIQSCCNVDFPLSGLPYIWLITFKVYVNVDFPLSWLPYRTTHIQSCCNVDFPLSGLLNRTTHIQSWCNVDFPLSGLPYIGLITFKVDVNVYFPLSWLPYRTTHIQSCCQCWLSFISITIWDYI